jgi:hypothetical protein
MRVSRAFLWTDAPPTTALAAIFWLQELVMQHMNVQLPVYITPPATEGHTGGPTAGGGTGSGNKDDSDKDHPPPGKSASRRLAPNE